MTGLRSLLRFSVVIATTVSWLAISNHCALAAFSVPQSLTAACPMHSKPVKQKPDAGLVCCKILRAQSVFVTVKAAAPPVQLLGATDSFGASLFVRPEAREPQLAKLDTGPSPPSSFAESVLQRSLRAHAPPSLG